MICGTNLLKVVKRDGIEKTINGLDSLLFPQMAAPYFPLVFAVLASHVRQFEVEVGDDDDDGGDGGIEVMQLECADAKMRNKKAEQ